MLNVPEHVLLLECAVVDGDVHDHLLTLTATDTRHPLLKIIHRQNIILGGNILNDQRFIPLMIII